MKHVAADREFATGPVQVVHLVEDDPATSVATVRFLQAAGHVVRAYGSAIELIAAMSRPLHGCAVVDLCLPGLSGLDLQKMLAAASDPLPIIFLSGAGEIRDSVTAMRAGAVDFLTKAGDSDRLLDAVSRAFARDREDRAGRERRRAVRARYDQLTAREQEVFGHLISGRLNKQIAADLGAAEATIKIHRHRVLAKMDAESIADLVRLAADLDIATASTAA